jgi:hypothetical protein
MDCLYSPYSFRRTEAGGFSAPMRILFTVLSAWLNTRSAISHVCQPSVPPSHSGESEGGVRRVSWMCLPTESDMIRVAVAGACGRLQL